MVDKTLPRRYARSLANHGYGHALYEPVSVQELSPGSCGYLNDEGAWNPILRLDDQGALQAHGLSLCDLERAPQSIREWGPKTSSNVKQRKIDLQGGASLIPAGVPADVGALFQYEINHNEGSILLTSSPVTKNSLRHEEPFKRWVKENARIIAKVWPDVLKHGLFVVTSTHSTREACLNILNNNSRTVTVGFHMGFVPVGEIAPSTAWHTSSTDGGWIRATAEKVGDEKVVFMGGLYFRWPFASMTTGYAKRISPEKWANYFRSDDRDSMTIRIPEINNDDDEGNSYRKPSFDIVYSPVGTDENRLAEWKPGTGEEAEIDDF